MSAGWDQGKSGELEKLRQVQRWLVQASVSLAREGGARGWWLKELERQHAAFTQELAATRAASVHLQAILASDGWAVLQRYYALRRTLLPPGSVRDRLFRLTLNVLAAPVSRRRRQEAGRMLAKLFGRLPWPLRQSSEVAAAATPTATACGPEAPAAGSLTGADLRDPLRAAGLLKTGVAYVIGMYGDSTRYRVFHLMEALRLGGVRSVAVPEHEIPAHLETLLAHDLLVLFREQYTPEVSLLIDRAKQRGIPLVFDVDDYVFEPAIVPDVDGIRTCQDTTPADYMRYVILHLAVIAQCDACTAPTNFLVEKLSRLGLPGHKVPNALSQEMLDICRRVCKRDLGRRCGPEVRIGYYPGTLTHQRDFATAYRALVRVLADFPQVRLVLAERLDLDEFPLPARFAARVERLPFVDWRFLPAEIARADIQIAPLEVGNAFCEAKSELKYFEAAAVRVPTIASPTGPFAAAITHGVNGLLANTEDEWYDGLKQLVTNPQLRSRIADNALSHVLAAYTPAQTLRAALAAYGEVLQHHQVRKGAAAAPRPGLPATPAAA